MIGSPGAFATEAMRQALDACTLGGEEVTSPLKVLADKLLAIGID
jgi:hypothetical protein